MTGTVQARLEARVLPANDGYNTFITSLPPPPVVVVDPRVKPQSPTEKDAQAILRTRNRRCWNGPDGVLTCMPDLTSLWSTRSRSNESTTTDDWLKIPPTVPATKTVPAGADKRCRQWNNIRGDFKNCSPGVDMRPQ
jgi:hypothetical protein